MVLDIEDTELLDDDTYTYTLTQNSVYLKEGYIRLVDSQEDEAALLDAVLDAILL